MTGPYEGELVPSIYGHCVRQPTGAGLPGYEPGRFSADLPSLREEEWCEESCVPRRDCVGCQKDAGLCGDPPSEREG